MRWGGAARAYVEALLVAVLLATFVRTYLFQAFRVPSASMAENLVAGDHILVNKFIFGGTPDDHLISRLLPSRPVRRGDVVVFRYPLDPSRDFVKRCMGVAGETVEIVDKVLEIDGRAIDETAYALHSDSRVFTRSHFLEESFRLRDNYGPYTVPEDHCFCLGDNRDQSNDSRFWGTVPSSMIKGRAWLIYWSTKPRDDVETRGTLGGLLARMRFWVTDVRAGRLFRLIR